MLSINKPAVEFAPKTCPTCGRVEREEFAVTASEMLKLRREIAGLKTERDMFQHSAHVNQAEVKSLSNDNERLQSELAHLKRKNERLADSNLELTLFLSSRK
jgi:predicted RNase H-like nuclease (RuvC/YqgF family)